jgi:hypothetical protein
LHRGPALTVGAQRTTLALKLLASHGWQGARMNALSLVTRADDAPPIASVPEILDELRRGNIVVLVDDEDRENEGDLMFAADFVTAER